MITIYASELSSCSGLNKYNPVTNVAKKVWCRNDPEGYRKALIRNETCDPEPIKETLDKLKLTERLQNIVQDNDSNLIQNKIRDITQDYKAQLDSNGVLLSDVTSFVHTERGKLHENDSLQRLEKILNVSISNRNDKFYKQIIEYKNSEGEIKKYAIGGKVDGITEDGYLVEVKNRQYKLFNDIPVYEKVQIHAYMYLTGFTECKFVQSYKNQDISTTEIFDCDFWEMIKERCAKFVNGIEILKTDIDAQDSLFSTGFMPQIHS